MDKLLTMSKKELTRLEVMQRLAEKRLKQREAAEQLGVSVRHLKRLLRTYRQAGAAGLVSKRRGRTSNNHLGVKVRKQAVQFIRKRYADFGPTLAHEKLTEIHGLQLSVESVRQLMVAAELWKPRRAKRARVHQMRTRRACFGELVQIDGSPFDWFEGRAPACSLLVFIDDATGRLLELYFTPQESFFSYCAALRRYFARHSKPLAFYSDKHGIFHVNAKNAVSGTGLTQFGRALQELDIQSICANTPQAKGRVERANQTLQDRLVKEMRLQSVSGLEAGNAFTPSSWTISTSASPSSPLTRATPIAHCCPPTFWIVSSPARIRAHSPRTSPYSTTRSSTRSRLRVPVMPCATPASLFMSKPTARSPSATPSRRRRGQRPATGAYSFQPATAPGRGRFQQVARSEAPQTYTPGCRSSLAHLWPAPERRAGGTECPTKLAQIRGYGKVGKHTHLAHFSTALRR